MQSQNFRDKEILAMTPDMEGVTRAKKDSKTKKFTFVINGPGNAPMKLTTYAETEAKAIKYIKARWGDCKYEVVK